MLFVVAILVFLVFGFLGVCAVSSGDDLAALIGVIFIAIGIFGGGVLAIAAVDQSDKNHYDTFKKVCAQANGRTLHTDAGDNICLTKGSKTIKIYVP